ncbi:hypothetical protein [Flavobacterium aciduliphilum]|uniref:Adenylosuccinate lyase n=1 Tax=Flavobacterium aciduliphilum TaxID=1101402 RepID=A0A328YL60_9FLAO|nr:hypothetical protein [Flavobacterium aciduliphilum]RAR74280.1 hypothetical protein CLV55_102214 [Flavobacterium aciduliphilum]
MNAEFYNQIAKSTAHRKSRDDNKEFIFANPNYLSDLTEIAFNTKDKNHHKACWILELICEERIELFIPFIDDFCEALPNFKNNPALRPTSKICMFLTQNTKVLLTEFQEEKIIETCLDRLIESDLAATAAYSMRALYQLGKKYDWVNDELKILLTRDLKKQTPGYIAATKDILKRLK